jgi:hypothetical protein
MGRLLTPLGGVVPADVRISKFKMPSIYAKKNENSLFCKVGYYLNSKASATGENSASALMRFLRTRRPFAWKNCG